MANAGPGTVISERRLASADGRESNGDWRRPNVDGRVANADRKWRMAKGVVSD